MAKKTDWAKVLNDSPSLAPNIFGVGVDISALAKAIKVTSPDVEAKAEKALHEASVVVTGLPRVC